MVCEVDIFYVIFILLLLSANTHNIKNCEKNNRVNIKVINDNINKVNWFTLFNMDIR